MKKIKVLKLTETATIPTKSHKTDAGWDLYFDYPGEMDIEGGFRYLASTGIALKIPEGYYGQIFDRSGYAFKKGLHTMAGVIDSSYRGEIKVLLYNTRQKEMDKVSILPGDRIAQIVILPVPEFEMEETKQLDETERSDGGFGSTGN